MENLEKGLNYPPEVEKYKKYFDIMRRNEISISLQGLEVLSGGLDEKKWVKVGPGHFQWKPTESKEEALDERKRTIEEGIRMALKLKEDYDKINIDEQDENTGKEIIMRTRDLIHRYCSLFIPIAEVALRNPEIQMDIPEELSSLWHEIFRTSSEYGKLPAYRTYRSYAISDEYCPGGMSRGEWLEAGKPVKEEWFEKWGLKPTT